MADADFAAVPAEKDRETARHHALPTEISGTGIPRVAGGPSPFLSADGGLQRQRAFKASLSQLVNYSGKSRND
jgi:hypothetical protein